LRLNNLNENFLGASGDWLLSLSGASFAGRLDFGDSNLDRKLDLRCAFYSIISLDGDFLSDFDFSNPKESFLDTFLGFSTTGSFDCCAGFIL